MRTNDNTNENPVRGSEPIRIEARKWRVLMDGEVIGTIHASTPEQARDIIAPFRMAVLTIEPES
jgi:hypothetical protein